MFYLQLYYKPGLVYFGVHWRDIGRMMMVVPMANDVWVGHPTILLTLCTRNTQTTAKQTTFGSMAVAVVQYNTAVATATTTTIQRRRSCGRCS